MTTFKKTFIEYDTKNGTHASKPWNAGVRITTKYGIKIVGDYFATKAQAEVYVKGLK